MNVITYEYGDALYINLTNRCPCACTFCLRQTQNGVGTGENLWLDYEPSLDEIKESISEKNLNDYKEVVFCGYGEPCERLDVLLETAKFIRQLSQVNIRLNTNGLSDLINSKPTAKLLSDCINSISISLNAPDSETYNALCHPAYDGAFEAMIRFALECKALIPDTCLSIVNVLPPNQQQSCRDLCAGLGIRLKIRTVS